MNWPQIYKGSVNAYKNVLAALLDQFNGTTREDDYSTTGHSYQSDAVDLTVGPNVGSTGSNPKFIAAYMGNLIGDALAKAGAYLGAMIGAYSVTGTKASTYPTGAVLAQISDGVTDVDGAVVAYIDGDSAVTVGGAAFKVRNNNSDVSSGFNFGLDLQDAAHDGFQPVDSAFYLSAPIRLVEDVVLLVGTAAPTNGTSGTGKGVAGPGSLHLCTADGKLRSNTNTKASPTWTVVGTQS